MYNYMEGGPRQLYLPSIPYSLILGHNKQSYTQSTVNWTEEEKMRVAGSATEFIQTSQYLAISVDMTLKEFQI